MEQKLTRLLLAATTLLALGACGDDGDDGPEHAVRTAPNGAEFNDADSEFATDMIQHHAQALAMVDLTLGRRLDPEVRRLAEDIRMAQAPEIAQLTGWLTDWDRPVPETVRDHANAHGDGHGAIDEDMPGMMSAEDMSALEAARGEEFRRLWLEMMVEHHQGAVEMARTEQDEGHFGPAVDLAEEIESAQEREIATMEELLGS